MRRLVLPMIILAAIMSLSAVCLAAADEYRAFWIDAWGAGVLSQSQVDTLLGVPGTTQKGQIRDANCNTVIIQVRRNCDANYPSSMGEPYMSGLSPSNFNSLQAVINAAHDTTGGKKRIDVHAWLVTFRTSGGAVYAAHSSTPTGSLVNLDNYWPSRDSSGGEVSDKAFDPGHPLAAEYTVNVFMDVATNFDVDGVHYDYIRFTGGDQGYNPTSIARYNARYGLTGQPTSTDDQFDQWRRDQITNLVRKVYAKVQAVKPNVKVSGSFVTWNPSPTASTRSAFQTTRPYGNRSDGVFCDWDAWLTEGIVDMAVPMTYYNYASLPSDWGKWINFEKDRHGTRHMIIGPGIYLNSLSNAILELQQTRTASSNGNYADGFSGYSYRVPYLSGTWAGFAPTLISQVTPDWANIPAMPWKSAPTKGHISGTVTYYTTGAWADGATVSITGPENRTMLCDGTGFYAFIDLTPGTYQMTVSKTGYPSLQRSVTVAIGSVTGNMYVNNFILGSTTPAPIISNVAASGLTTTGATITWTTDQASTSQVEYGLTSSYGSTSPLDSNLVTSHSVTLSGLTTGTVYHYRVISTNSNGTTASNDYTFTTVGPPIISNVTATNLTNNSATITWTTDQASSTQVGYGLTTSYGSSTPLDSTPVTSHSATITGLSAKTLYHYRARSSNANGLSTSADYTFTTTGAPVISGVTVSGITTSSATLTWTTDELSNGTVNYGTTTSYGSSASDPNTSTKSHSVTLSSLDQNTQYHYQCVSTNPYGSDTSVDNTFTTAAVVSEIVIDNTDPGWANTSPSGSWNSGSSSAVPKIGTNYLYASGSGSTSTITKSCKWTPTINTAGNYDVWVYYQMGTNRNSAAPYTVYYNGGQVTSIQNQYSSTPNQGGWFLIGSNLPFVEGTSGYVGLTNASADTSNVSADAAKFVLVGPTDSTPPVMSSVTANGPYTSSTTTLDATWAATDPESGVTRYEYAVGTTVGGTQAKDWTNAGSATSLTITGLSMTSGNTYYVSARAVNGANLTSTAMTASGVTVDTSAPVMSSVVDEKYTLSTNSLQASWSAADPQSGILRYEYAVGDTPSGTEMRSWTSVGLATSATISGLSLAEDGIYYVSARAVNNAGLTSEPMGTDDGVTVATAVTSINAAKDYDDGKAVYVPARTITAKYPDRFYIEEEDRSSGICVNSTTTSAVGQALPVFGRLGLVDGGERALINCKVVEPGSAGAIIDPLAIITKSAGGKTQGLYTPGIPGGEGLNNLGLLVTIAGKVTKKAAGYIYVDDGSGLEDGSSFNGIRVDTTNLTTVPDENKMVIITGISSVYNNGGSIVRMIRAKGDLYVTVYTP